MGKLAPGSAADVFKITLRRANDVPLGMSMSADARGCLVVKEIQANSAVVSWNKQNAGGLREIREGDLVVSVNGAEEAQAMVNECNTSRLVKLTLQRPSRACRSMFCV